MKKAFSSVNWWYRSLFLLLAVMSVYFFKERLFVDSSYMIFSALNEGWFHIEHGRPALGIAQFLPLVGSALHLPLKVLLILYSLGQVLIFYLLYLLLTKVLKQASATVALMGIALVGQGWLYYVPMLEIVMGGALAVLVMGIMRTEKWRDDKWFLLLLFAYWFVITSHPMNYLLALVLIVYDIGDRGWKKKLHYSMIAFFFAAVIVGFLRKDPYEASLIVGIEDSGLKNLFDFNYLKNAILVFLQKYWLILIMGIWTTIVLLKRKKMLLFLIWPAAAFILILAAIYRWNISSDNWYTEIVYQPLVSITLILFAFTVLDGFSEKVQNAWNKAFGLLYIGFAIALIYNSSYMTARTAQIVHLTDQLQSQEIDKAIINFGNIDRPYNKWEWSVPVEALLISALDGPEQSVSMITNQELEYNYNKKRLTDSSFVFRMFQVMRYDQLNDRYFKLGKHPYQRVNSSKNLNTMKSMKDQIKIHPPENDSIYKVKAGGEQWIDVVIENQSQNILPSSLENYLFIASHWYHADTLYNWDGIRTPLELDIIGEHQQQIRINCPEEKGIYEIQFDLVKEGEYWLMLQPKYIIQVY